MRLRCLLVVACLILPQAAHAQDPTVTGEGPGGCTPAPAWLEACNAALSRGQTAEAIQVLEPVVAATPEDWLARWRLAWLLEFRGGRSGAMHDVFFSSMRASEKAGFGFSKADLDALWGEWAAARAGYDAECSGTVRVDGAPDRNPHLRRWYCRVRLGERAAADADLQQWVDAAGLSAGRAAQQLLLPGQFLLGAIDEAAFQKKSMGVFRDTCEFVIGMKRRADGDEPGSARILRHWLAAEPALWVWTWEHEAASREIAPIRRAAVPEPRPGGVAAPVSGDLMAEFQLCALLQAGKLDEAVAGLTALRAKCGAEFVPGIFPAGDLFFRRGEWAQAAQEYGRRAALEDRRGGEIPVLALVHLRQMIARARTGEREQAEWELTNRLANQDPLFTGAFVRSTAAWLLGKLSREEYLKTAADLDAAKAHSADCSIVAQYFVGAKLRLDGKADDAVREFRKCLEIAPVPARVAEVDAEFHRAAARFELDSR